MTSRYLDSTWKKDVCGLKLMILRGLKCPYLLSVHCVCACVLQPQMIVDLAHVPLTQRTRADAPFNKISESPLPEDAVQIPIMMTTEVSPAPEVVQSTVDHESVPAEAPGELSQSPNHLPTDAPGTENTEAESPQWNITTKDTSDEVDSNTDNAPDNDTKDRTDPSKSKPSAALPKLIIPDPNDETSARKRR